jgi:hypothetical protein
VGMTLDPIHDFIQAWKQWDHDEDKGRDGESTQPFWNLRLQDAGYYCMEPSRESIRHYWQEMHHWCEQQFGKDRYAWTGSTFWFETEHAAVLFALRWS